MRGGKGYYRVSHCRFSGGVDIKDAGGWLAVGVRVCRFFWCIEIKPIFSSWGSVVCCRVSDHFFSYVFFTSFYVYVFASRGIVVRYARSIGGKRPLFSQGSS